MLGQLLNLIQNSYDQGLDDYWLPPLVKCGADNLPVGRVQDQDVLIFACRRGEREIQLTEAFVDPDFHHFPREYLSQLQFFPMVEYHRKFADYPPLFHSIKPESPLGEVLAEHGLRQLRIAESEKFAHVTYFFNGRREEPFPQEDWIMIPSIREAVHQNPQMRSAEIAETLMQSLQTGHYEFALVNFAAGDIFGHIPDFQAQVACVEAIDQALGRIAAAAQSLGYCLIVTADHGLLEQAYLPDGSHSIGHTRAKVPFILVDPTVPQNTISLAPEGSLQDVAPTILNLLGLEQPNLMTGRSLVQPYLTSVKGVVLIVLDGFGIGAEARDTNPIYAADTPTLDRLYAHYPHTALHASGTYVGLAPDSGGNSETGHLTLGAGRIVPQDETRIPKNLTPLHLKENSRFYHSIKHLSPEQSVHLLFLLSPKSSHGSTSEALSLLRVLQEWGAKQVYLHAITDGRSAPRFGAVKFLPELQTALIDLGIGELVTVCGRGYMLDRSGYYLERTQSAYEALVKGRGACWMG